MAGRVYLKEAICVYYGEIKKTDIANGVGVRVTLFVSGCTRACKNCFNPDTWDFRYGQPFTAETEAEIINALRPSHVNGLTLLGGEPFEPDNQRALLPFVERVRRELPDKTIWAFSGRVLESELLNPDCHQHCEVTEKLLSLLDVLVDGPYVDELRDITLRFRGSRNQRILDMKRTMAEGHAVLWEG